MLALQDEGRNAEEVLQALCDQVSTTLGGLPVWLMVSPRSAEQCPGFASQDAPQELVRALGELPVPSFRKTFPGTTQALVENHLDHRQITRVGGEALVSGYRRWAWAVRENAAETAMTGVLVFSPEEAPFSPFQMELMHHMAGFGLRVFEASRAPLKEGSWRAISRSIFQALPEPGLLIDALDGRILEANKAACLLYGYTPGEMMTLGMSDISVHGAPAWHRHQEGKRRRMHRKKDGSPFTVEITATPFLEGPRPMALLLVRDSTVAALTEEALRESEARFKGLFESAPVSIWEEDFSGIRAFLQGLGVTHPDGLHFHLAAHPEYLHTCLDLIRVRNVNLKSLELYGVSEKVALFNHLGCFHDDSNLHVLARELETFLRGHGTFETELQTRSAKGDPRDIYLVARIPPGAAEDWSQLLVYLVDITERRRAERLQAAAHQLLETSLVAVDEPGILHSLWQAVRISGLPEAFCVRLARQQGSTGGCWFPPGLSPTTLEALACHAREPQESEHPAGAPAAMAFPMQTEHGPLGTLVFLGQEGVDVLPSQRPLMAFLADQTAVALERKRALEELRRSRLRLSEAQSMADMGSCEVDLRLREVFWSDEARSLWRLPAGTSPPSIRGLIARIHREDRAAFIHAAREMLIHNTPMDLEFRLLEDHGHLAMKARVERDLEGQPIRLVGAFQDVTRRRRMEASLRENEARYRHLAEENAELLTRSRQEAEVKSMLLQEVNHRVKNNLTSILGMLDMEFQACVGTGSALTHAFEDLKNRIFALASVHELLSAAEWSPLRIESLATDLIRNALAGSPVSHQVRVDLSPPREAIWVVPSAATALAMILAELTTNSVKYAFEKRGEGRIHVRIRSLKDEWNRVCLTFQDDGPGFPQDVLAGWRENVGLSLIRLNVKSLLKGEIALDNARGARVRITFQPMPLPRHEAFRRRP